MISLWSIWKLESPTTQYTSLSGSANFTPRVAATSYPIQEYPYSAWYPPRLSVLHIRCIQLGREPPAVMMVASLSIVLLIAASAAVCVIFPFVSFTYSGIVRGSLALISGSKSSPVYSMLPRRSISLSHAAFAFSISSVYADLYPLARSFSASASTVAFASPTAFTASILYAWNLQLLILTNWTSSFWNRCLELVVKSDILEPIEITTSASLPMMLEA